MFKAFNSRRFPETVLLLCISALLLTSLNLHAATFEVTDAGDNGPGTLRQAVLDANANGNPNETDTITFATGVDHISLATARPPDSLGPLVVLEPLHIQGNGKDKTLLDGYIFWVTGSGDVNAPFIDDPGSVSGNNSGLIFEVGVFEGQNTDLEFTLSDLSVTKTGGIVEGRQNTKITIENIRGYRNAWNP